MLQGSSHSPLTPRPRPPRHRSWNSQQSSLRTNDVHSASKLGQETAEMPARDPTASYKDKQRTFLKQDSKVIPNDLNNRPTAPVTPPYTPPLLQNEKPQRATEDAKLDQGPPKEMGWDSNGADSAVRDLDPELGSEASADESTVGETIDNAKVANDKGIQEHLVGTDVGGSSAEYASTLMRARATPPSSILRPNGQTLPESPARRGLVQHKGHLPPSSPGSAKGIKFVRHKLDDEVDWTDVEEAKLKHNGWTQGHRRTPSGNSITSPSSGRRRFNGRTYSISSISSQSQRSIGRSQSTLNIYYASLASAAQLQNQHAHLSAQNAELEKQLEDLEAEMAKADVSGKKRLRKLNKELSTLKTELEIALDRNKELEDNLRSQIAVSSTGSVSHPRARLDVDEDADTSDDADDVWFDSILHGSAPLQPTLDFDTTVRALESEGADTGDGTASSSSNSSHRKKRSTRRHPEPALVSQLLGKISELEETNAAVSAHETELSERLEKAARDFEDMKRKYDFLEERVIDAEMHNHRVVGWHRKGLIDWKPEQDDVSRYDQSSAWYDTETQLQEPLTASPPPRNKLKSRSRPSIERHRRLSSLLGDQIARIGYISPSPTSTPNSSPEKASTRPSPSHSVLFSDSPTHFGLTRAALPRDHEDTGAVRHDAEDQVESSISRSATRTGFLGIPLTEDKTWKSNTAYQTTVSASPSFSNFPTAAPTPFGSIRGAKGGLHSLASELGPLWDLQDSQPGALSPTRSDATSAQNSSSTFRNRSSLSVSLPLPLALAVVRARKATPQDYDADELAALVPEGPPDAESYEALEKALADLPIDWADEDLIMVERTLLRDIEAAHREGEEPKTRHGTLTWAYNDSESDDDEKDPWRDEGRATLRIESREEMEARVRADERSARRRMRLQELAREMEEDEEDDDGRLFQKRMEALRRLGSEPSLADF